MLLAQSFGGLIVFLALLLTVGRWGLDALMRRVMAQGSSVTAALTISLVAALTGGLITQFLRLEAILGALFARERDPERRGQHVEVSMQDPQRRDVRRRPSPEPTHTSCQGSIRRCREARPSP